MPRVRLANPTPAVLRFQDGSRLPGNLQVISLAGGMLRLSQPLDPNTRTSLMFLSDRGPVVGKAEMLSPLSHTQQAFRFVALDQKHRHNLQLWIQSLLSPSSDEELWISKYRFAINHRPKPGMAAWKIVLGSVTFGILILSAAYFVHLQLLK